MTELKTLKDLVFIGHKDKSSGQIVLETIKAEAVKIFNESLTIEEFGKKMIRFFEIQEEDLK